MTALALTGIAIFAAALAAIGVAYVRRARRFALSVRRHGLRPALLSWAAKAHAEQGYHASSRARWPRG